MSFVIVLALALGSAALIRPFRPAYPTFKNWWDAEGLPLFFLLAIVWFLIVSLLGFHFPVSEGYGIEY